MRIDDSLATERADKRNGERLWTEAPQIMMDYLFLSTDTVRARALIP